MSPPVVVCTAVALVGVVVGLYVYQTLRLTLPPPPPDPPPGDVPALDWREAAALMGTGDVLLVTFWYGHRRSAKSHLLWRAVRSRIVHVAPVVRAPTPAIRRAYGLPPAAADEVVADDLFVLEVGPPRLTLLLPLAAWMLRQRGCTVLWRKLLPLLPTPPAGSDAAGRRRVLRVHGLPCEGAVEAFFLRQRGVTYPTPLDAMVQQALGTPRADRMHCADAILGLYAAAGLLRGEEAAGGRRPFIVPGSFLWAEPLATLLGPSGGALCRCQRLLDQTEAAEGEVGDRGHHGQGPPDGAAVLLPARPRGPASTVGAGVADDEAGVVQPQVEPEGKRQRQRDVEPGGLAALGGGDAPDEDRHGAPLGEGGGAGLALGRADAGVDKREEEEVEPEEPGDRAVAPSDEEAGHRTPPRDDDW